MPKTKQKQNKKTDTYTCTKCGKVYKTAQGLAAHAILKHGEESSIAIIKNGVVTLRPQKEMFLQYYIVNEETRNNGTLSYALAYKYDLDSKSTVRETKTVMNLNNGQMQLQEIIGTSEYDRACQVCAVCAHKLLRITKVNARSIQLRNALLTDEIVDGELAKVVMIKDPTEPAKMAGIREYDALRGRVIEKKLNLNINTTLQDIADAALQKRNQK